MTYKSFLAKSPFSPTSEQLDLVNSKFDSEAPPAWRDFAEINFAALRSCIAFAEKSDDQLALMAVYLAYQFAESYGGCGVYVPKADKLIKRINADSVVAEFNGKNIRELATKYKISEVHVRQIIEIERAKKGTKLKSRA